MKENFIQEDEIDLKELFQTLWAKKVFVIMITFLATIFGIIYVLVKNPIPIYEGKVLLEIGEIQNQNGGSSYFDTPNNLAEILKARYGVESSPPKGTNKLLEITTRDINKQVIQDNLETSIQYIMQRHKEKAKFYENYIMTEQLSSITINPEAINEQNKKLIITVAFITGLILSIFMVFFMQFIQNFRGEKND